MDLFTLTTAALQEPWRLWTCHLVHFGWVHALANGVALAVPWLLVDPADRARVGLALALLAPLLSLLLLLSLPPEGTYRGASGLACGLWGLAGVRLLKLRKTRVFGVALLGALAFKLVAEQGFGIGLLQPAGWRVLPAAHGWGALLGLLAGLLSRPFPWAGSRVGQPGAPPV